MELLLVLALGFAGYKAFVWWLDQTRQAEYQRAAILEDQRFDQIVNCPTCEGTGECWMDHRVTSGGHVLTKPERRADIERMMDENYNYIRPESHFSVDAYGTSYSYKRAVCPHCEGAGTAHARFETIPGSQASCGTCSGRGVVTETVKAAVGVNKVQARCSVCAGSGQTTVPQVRKVHVKFLKAASSGGPTQTIDLASFKPADFFDVSKPRLSK